MHLAITGATSGVGRRLVEVARARGLGVRALVRDPRREDARALAALDVALQRGDVNEPAALAATARGSDVFVHMAARVGDIGPLADFERVNVEGTRLALQAAADAGVSRFVHLSSSAVYGRPDAGRVTEEWPTRKSGMAYEDTKTDAERVAFERGGELGLSVVAVRPPVIYGPYDRNFLPRAMAALAGRRFLLVDGGRAPLNLVWVDHVVDVVLRAAARSDLGGEAFNVMDEVAASPPSVREVAETIAREAGLPAPRLSLPYPVAMGLGHAVARGHAWLSRLRRAEVDSAPPLSPFVVKILTRHVIYDASKAARVLGWKPEVGSLEGIARFAREASARRTGRIEG